MVEPRQTPPGDVRQRGVTLVDLVAAFAVLSVVGLGVGLGARGQGGAVTRAFQETVAWRQAQSCIERIRAGRERLVVGRAAIELDAGVREQLPDVHGERHVRAVEPGLLEVWVEVRWRVAGAPARVALTTLVATEETP